MKLKILIVLLITSSVAQSQQFKFNNDATSAPILVEVQGMKASELYSKAINWANTYYKNPEIVIKAKVENEMIRIEAIEKSAFFRTIKDGNVKAEYDVAYTLTLEFQDGKYRASYQHDRLTDKVYFTIADVFNNIADTNNNGWDGSKESYEATVQKLLDRLKDYITKPKEKW